MVKWKVLGSEKIIDSKWLGVEKHRCDIGGGKIVEDFYVARKRDFVVLVVDIEEQVLLVKEYRHGIRDYSVNLPMGFIDEGENPEEAARRELLEETGYFSRKMEYLGEFYQSPSWTLNRCHVFYVKDPVLKQEAKPEETEGDLSAFKIYKSELKKMLENNQLKDVSSVMAVHLARERLRF